MSFISTLSELFLSAFGAQPQLPFALPHSIDQLLRSPIIREYPDPSMRDYWMLRRSRNGLSRAFIGGISMRGLDKEL